MAVQEQKVTERYAVYLGDAIEVLKNFRKESVHLSIYSPPFATSGGALYRYSSSERDISNSLSYEQFFDHYSYLMHEVWRLTMPGRISAVHCMDIASVNTGNDHLTDFPGDIIRLHAGCREKNCKANHYDRTSGKCGHGLWHHTGRYCVWKEPLKVRNRTMAKHLFHKVAVEDSARCSPALADYVLIFRKKGDNAVPIAHPRGLIYYAGERKPPADVLHYKGWKGDQIQNRYSHWIWRQYASAFWDDIRVDHVLKHRQARDEQDEDHVHPLQLDVIDRIVTLWSNPGETVLSPCAGVGSEVYGALCNDRRAIGVELKPSYYRMMLKNISEAKVREDDDEPTFSFYEKSTEGEVEDVEAEEAEATA